MTPPPDLPGFPRRHQREPNLALEAEMKERAGQPEVRPEPVSVERPAPLEEIHIPRDTQHRNWSMRADGSQRWYATWSPPAVAAMIASILGAFTAASVTVIQALGGADNVIEIIGVSRSTAERIAETETRIVAKIDELATIEARERGAITKTQLIEKQRTARLAEGLCRLNGRPLYEGQPCPQAGDFTQPASRPPPITQHHQSSLIWPALKDSDQ